MRYKKSLGQHFLIDENIKRKIVDLADIKGNDFILEIGPGDGALTDLIYKKSKNLILVEKDDFLCTKLSKKFKKAKVLNIDFLEFNFKNFKEIKFKILGNLPYNVATQIIYKVIENLKYWDISIFMVQKEVAERIVSKKNRKEYSMISVISQAFCEVEKEFDVSPDCFFPKPKVYSSIIKMKPKEHKIDDFKKFLIFVKALFYGRRKKLLNAVKKNPFLSFPEKFILNLKDNFGENVRIEDLSVKDIIQIYFNFNEISGSRPYNHH